MMTVEKMAKVVSEINRGLASSRPQGVSLGGASQAHTNSDPTCACVCLDLMDANTDVSKVCI